MFALFLLGGQFQWNYCALEPQRCDHDCCFSGSITPKSVSIELYQRLLISKLKDTLELAGINILKLNRYVDSIPDMKYRICC
jgi:hypothetical protein